VPLPPRATNLALARSGSPPMRRLTRSRSPPCTAVRNSTAVGASPGMVPVVVPSVMTTVILGCAPPRKLRQTRGPGRPLIGLGARTEPMECPRAPGRCDTLLHRPPSQAAPSLGFPLLVAAPRVALRLRVEIGVPPMVNRTLDAPSAYPGPPCAGEDVLNLEDQPPKHPGGRPRHDGKQPLTISTVSRSRASSISRRCSRHPRRRRTLVSASGTFRPTVSHTVAESVRLSGRVQGCCGCRSPRWLGSS
jgi:hypothetical protein